MTCVGTLAFHTCLVLHFPIKHFGVTFSSPAFSVAPYRPKARVDRLIGHRRLMVVVQYMRRQCHCQFTRATVTMAAAAAAS